MSQEVDAHLEGLFKELTCAICRDVIEPPVGRLPCCHYFCRICVTEAIKHAQKCPECSIKATRRDVADDPTMDRIAAAVRGLQGARGELVAAARAAAAGGPAPDADAIPWLQGVDDAVFAESPTRSLSASAMDRLRGRDGAAGAEKGPAAAARGRSPSPMVLHRRTSDQGTSKSSGAAKAKAGGRKRANGDGSGSQSIHKWLKKDAAGAKAPAPAAETPKEPPPPQQQEDGSPDASGSLLLPGAAEDAARQLDDIVAGLDVAESQPPSAVTAPAAAPAVAALAQLKKKEKGETKKQPAAGKKKGSVAAAVDAPSDKENNRSGGGKKRRAAEAEAAALEEAGGSRRRIPTRLVPWACVVCTFENKGGEAKCQMCSTAKGAETPPAAVAAIAAAAPATTASPAPGTAAAAAAAGLAVTGAKDAGSGRAPGKKDARRGAAAAQQRKLTTSKKTRDRRLGAEIAEEAPVETPAAPAGAVWTAGPQSWVLLGSGLDQAGKEVLAQLAAASGASVAEAWAPEVTHIVCGGTAGRAAHRTFKFLMGVLHGRWVVTQEWASACLTAGNPEKEERFEVRFDGAACACGAAAARTAGASAARHLLRGFDVQLQGEFANRGQVETLLRAAGANVVTRLPASSGAGRGTRSVKTLSGGGVVLVEIPDISEAAAAGFRAAIAAQPWFARAIESGVPVAAHRWATDSISRFQACPLDKYLVKT